MAGDAAGDAEPNRARPGEASELTFDLPPADEGAKPVSFTFLDLDADEDAVPVLPPTPETVPSAEFDLEPAAALELTAGDLVGDYRVTGRLGEGAMSLVLAGEHVTRGDAVAIKILRGGLGHHPTIRERFRREAAAIASLRHPRIVRIHDHGLVQAHLYMVLERLDGGSLGERLRAWQAAATRVPREQAVELACQLLDGLAAAHATGFLHRDVKPDNVLFDAAGELRLVDFGLVKLLNDSGEGATPNPATMTALTIQGTLLGTPRYAAPEQLLGRPADARSDLFAVGAILYELLSGRVPFPGESVGALVREHVQSRPRPVGEGRDDISPALEAAVQRLLEADPKRRFQSAREALDALQAS